MCPLLLRTPSLASHADPRRRFRLLAGSCRSAVPPPRGLSARSAPGCHHDLGYALSLACASVSCEGGRHHAEHRVVAETEPGTGPPTGRGVPVPTAVALLSQGPLYAWGCGISSPALCSPNPCTDLSRKPDASSVPHTTPRPCDQGWLPHILASPAPGRPQCSWAWSMLAKPTPLSPMAA